MYKLDKENKYEGKINLSSSTLAGERLLAEIELNALNKLTSNNIITKCLKGTIHISCWLLESSMRKRRLLRGEENPKKRVFKL